LLEAGYSRSIVVAWVTSLLPARASETGPTRSFFPAKKDGDKREILAMTGQKIRNNTN
jgi:hypothetical protein